MSSEQMFTIEEAARLLRLNEQLVAFMSEGFSQRPWDFPDMRGGMKRIDLRRVFERRDDRLLVSWSGLLVLSHALGKPESMGRLIAMVMPSMPQEVLDFLELAGTWSEEFHKEELEAGRARMLGDEDEDDEDEDEDGRLLTPALLAEFERRVMEEKGRGSQ